VNISKPFKNAVREERAGEGVAGDVIVISSDSVANRVRPQYSKVKNIDIKTGPS
jgi:hypothetical protein